jgi:hypothetical protein
MCFKKSAWVGLNTTDWSRLFLLKMGLLRLVGEGDGVNFVLFVISKGTADFRVTYAPPLCLSYIIWCINDIAWVEYTTYLDWLSHYIYGASVSIKDPNSIPATAPISKKVNKL